MRKRILMLAVLCMALLSCRQEEAPLPAGDAPSERIRLIAADADPVRISYGEAVGELEAMLEAMDGGPKTKSGVRRIGRMEAVTSGLRTRSGNVPDTLLYVVDLEGGEGGYAVMSALRTMPSTLVIADQGRGDAGRLTRMITNTATEADLADETAFADRLIVDYVRTAQNGYNDPPLSGEIIWSTPTGGYGPWYVGEFGPFIETKWGQRFPGNIYLSGKPVGCTTIAQAQLMAYFQFPESLRKPDGTLFWPQWKLMTDSVYNCNFRRCHYPPANLDVATLCNILVNDNHVVWTEDGGGAYITAIAASMAKYGYKNCRAVKGYSTDVVKSYLMNSKPYLITASSSKDPACHMWLLDGLEMCERKIYVYEGNYPNRKLVFSHKEYKEYVHCNFGYNGLKDGWYAHAIFHFSKGPIERDEYFDRNRDTLGQSNNIYYDTGFYYNSYDI